MKLTNKIKLFLIGLFYGLKSADVTMLHQDDNNEDDTNINQQMKIDNVMNDFLQEQETQKVIETRDAYYRLLFEADKYTVKMTFNDEGELTGAKAYRNNGKWVKAPDNIDTEDKLRVRVIQDNEAIPKEGNIIVPLVGDYDPTASASYKKMTEEIKKDLLKRNPNEEYVMLLDLDYGDFKPRYRLDKYVKRMVVKGEDLNDITLEFYVSIYQEQFNKIHALFLSEIDRIKKNEKYKSDILEFSKAGFVTNGRAWGASPGAVFSYEDIKFNGIREYDGNYILSFKCKAIKDGENIGEKYRTKELDEKYEQKAPKHEFNTYDVDAALSEMSKNGSGLTDFNTTTLKLS